jgi:hypothetical protein
VKRLTRPAFWVPLLSALPVLSLLALGTAPAQATFAARAAPRFIAIDLGPSAARATPTTRSSGATGT